MTRLKPYDTLSIITALIYPHSVSDITIEAILGMFRQPSDLNSNLDPDFDPEQIVREASALEFDLPGARPTLPSKT